MIDSIKVDDKYVGRAISALPLKDGASLFGIKRKSGKVLIYDLMSNIEVESGIQHYISEKDSLSTKGKKL